MRLHACFENGFDSFELFSSHPAHGRSKQGARLSALGFGFGSRPSTGPKIHNSAHSTAHVQPLAMTTVETLTAGITTGKTTEDRAPHAAEMGKLVASDPTAMKELWCAPSR